MPLHRLPSGQNTQRDQQDDDAHDYSACADQLFEKQSPESKTLIFSPEDCD
ncbi:hypothetical protein [Sulfuricella sp.]|uniref:hypothetical protein n=1 Tax=Sulfuricella sp. TaxID=2099377 RepID=UPI002CE02C9B|nr:hypothetical protein [Sulfuricella sp.]HUX62134.1 hypothetical protein [Sulfuricella sp.]